MRLFVGIPLARKVTGELSATLVRLRSDADGLRWSAPESWHITLQFLGNTEEEQYGCIVDWLRQLRLPPVSIRLDTLGFFDRAGIFFVGVRSTPELLLLRQRVIAATGLCGFVAESRSYQPHITLARSKGKNPGQGLRPLKARLQGQHRFSSFVAKEFLLYESLPGPNGSHYLIRKQFPLSGR